jgi:hypothetical protein
MLVPPSSNTTACTARSKAGEKAVKKAKTQFGAGGKLDGFQDWPELPDDADLLCIFQGERGGAHPESYWYMPAERQEVSAGKDSTVQLCLAAEKGKYPPPGPDREWTEIIRRIRDSELWDPEEDAAIVEMGELARRFL